MRSMLVTTALGTIAAVVLMETPALPQVDTNSGNYMLPLCQAFLRMQSHDMATITNELSTGGARSGDIPSSMMQAGMCAGEVIGIAEMLKGSDQAPRACIPKEVTKEQLVRVAWPPWKRTPRTCMKTSARRPQQLLSSHGRAPNDALRSFAGKSI